MLVYVGDVGGSNKFCKMSQLWDLILEKYFDPGAKRK